MSKRSKVFLAHSNVFSDEESDDSDSKTKNQRTPFSSDFADHETSTTISNIATTSITAEEERPVMVNQEGDDDEDALDAYMKQVETRIQIEKHQQQDNETLSKTHTSHAIREDIEQADELESYMAFLASKGIDIEEFSTMIDHSKVEVISPENSDEEVYATARAIDSG